MICMVVTIELDRSPKSHQAFRNILAVIFCNIQPDWLSSQSCSQLYTIRCLSGYCVRVLGNSLHQCNCRRSKWIVLVSFVIVTCKATNSQCLENTDYQQRWSKGVRIYAWVSVDDMCYLSVLVSWLAISIIGLIRASELDIDDSWDTLLPEIHQWRVRLETSSASFGVV